MTVSKGQTPISLRNLTTYTGKPMIMTCTISDSLNLGNISANWTLNETEINKSERINISTSGETSTLTIKKVLLRDIGKSKLADYIRELIRSQ